MEKKSHVRLVHVIRGVLLACLVMSAALFAAPQTQAATANEKTTFEFLTSHMGLNPAAACGIMGSIKAESNFTSDIYGLGGAYGLCQWMGIRVTRLKNYCSQHGLDYTSLKGQLYYLEYETKTTFPSVYNYLKSVSNTSEGAYNAGYYWCYNFEIPGDRHNASVYRAKIARDTFWKEFGGSYVQVSGAQAGTGVKLTWTGTSKYGFAVRRSENETAGYTVVGKAGASTKAFVDTKVLPGHTYYYCVRPLNADGSLGNKSNIISVHVKASLTDSRCKITVGARVFV